MSATTTTIPTTVPTAIAGDTTNTTTQAMQRLLIEKFQQQCDPSDFRIWKMVDYYQYTQPEIAEELGLDSKDIQNAIRRVEQIKVSFREALEREPSGNSNVEFPQKQGLTLDICRAENSREQQIRTDDIANTTSDEAAPNDSLLSMYISRTTSAMLGNIAYFAIRSSIISQPTEVLGLIKRAVEEAANNSKNLCANPQKLLHDNL